MAEVAREVLITGIGIVSCLGEGADAHWQRLNEPPPAPDREFIQGTKEDHMGTIIA